MKNCEREGGSEGEREGEHEKESERELEQGTWSIRGAGGEREREWDSA